MYVAMSSEEKLASIYLFFPSGLVECLVAGAAARIGKTVLHLDR